jgi:hypothetical protein
MEQMKTTLVEALEKILANSAMPYAALEAMTLSELLYYALVESGYDQGSMRDGTLQGA